MIELRAERRSYCDDIALYVFDRVTHSIGKTIEMERVETAINQWGKRFLNRIYTEAELRTCQDGFSSLASRFAAKEAVMKVLGTCG